MSSWPMYSSISPTVSERMSFSGPASSLVTTPVISVVALYRSTVSRFSVFIAMAA